MLQYQLTEFRCNLSKKKESKPKVIFNRPFGRKTAIKKEPKSPNIYRLLKLNDRKAIMLYPVAINSLDLCYAIKPLSSF